MCHSTGAHPACLIALHNRQRAHLKKINLKSRSKCDTKTDNAYPLAFSEQVTYIVETKSSFGSPAIFRLADMVNLYKQHLEQLGTEAADVNSTWLKDKLLAETPELEAHKKGCPDGFPGRRWLGPVTSL